MIGRVLGIDFGTKRIGLALTDAMGMMSLPHSVLARVSNDTDIEAIAALVSEQSVAAVVVGHPLNMDGSAGPSAQAAAVFADKLRERLNLPVELFDERLTTSQAQRMLTEEADMSRAGRRTVVDKVAASMMLQAWLDMQAGR